MAVRATEEIITAIEQAAAILRHGVVAVKQPERQRIATLLESHAKAFAELIAAADEALESDGGLRYEGEHDDCGDHACCWERSYEPHAADCWVPRLRAALSTVSGK